MLLQTLTVLPMSQLRIARSKKAAFCFHHFVFFVDLFLFLRNSLKRWKLFFSRFFTTLQTEKWFDLKKEKRRVFVLWARSVLSELLRAKEAARARAPLSKCGALIGSRVSARQTAPAAWSPAPKLKAKTRTLKTKLADSAPIVFFTFWSRDRTGINCKICVFRDFFSKTRDNWTL